MEYRQSLFCWGSQEKVNLPTGYTRKIFHFLIFITSFIIQLKYGLTLLCLFGACTTLALAIAVVLGEGNVLYEGIAREKDAPKKTMFIIVPYLSTLIGGVCANVWFGPLALIGYLVTGLGDALAEPVGTKFGKHPYRVLTLGGVPANRSLEGSAAVLLASWFAIVVSWLLLNQEMPWVHLLGLAFLLALISAVLEAISPHGLDNLTLQLAPSALSFWFLAAT